MYNSPMRGNFFANIIIFVAVFNLIYIYSPIIKTYFFPPKIEASQIDTNKFAIFIPKISAYSPIVANVDPFKKEEYLEKLKHGVAQAYDTNYYFAHSSDYPWNITKYNTAFFKLHKLNIGDEIVIFKDNEKMTYFVTDKKVVGPQEVSFLEDAMKDQSKNDSSLILQTCTPVGTSLKRLLVFATLQPRF